MILNNKKTFLFLLVLSVLVVPVFSYAAVIIPTCDAVKGCGFQEFIQLINNVVNYLVLISFPIATLVFAWAGFNMMLDAGNGAKRRESIEMMKKVMIGFAIILVAWILVSTLLKALLSPDFSNVIQVVQ